MHAMGPNVAGVIGTAVAAGAMLTLLTKVEGFYMQIIEILICTAAALALSFFAS